MRPQNEAVGPAPPLLEVSHLTTEFSTEAGTVRAVEDVSFELSPGEMLGIVGESGSGKSVTSLSIMGLLPPRGRVVRGSVRFAGRELLGLSERELNRLRGGRIAMIFQDPMTSLNPYLRVREQLEESVHLHARVTRAEARERSLALLERVRIPDARARLESYPHELSGGMRQRVMIAMALLGNPDVLIADEPTTALDVTIQAQILDLLSELQRERGLAVVLITHDLGIVKATCDRALVFYAGRIVETAPTLALFDRPLHPYSAALIRSLPRLHEKKLPEPIPGLPPRLDQESFTACTFLPRCRYAHDACRHGDPELVEAEPGRLRRCVLPVERLTATGPPVA